jgi:hypothetical protein
MSRPRPSDVDSNDLYNRFGPEPLINRTREFRDAIMAAVRDPDDAQGWPAILIPAIVSALLINVLRRWV